MGWKTSNVRSTVNPRARTDKTSTQIELKNNKRYVNVYATASQADSEPECPERSVPSVTCCTRNRCGWPPASSPPPGVGGSLPRDVSPSSAATPLDSSISSSCESGDALSFDAMGNGAGAITRQRGAHPSAARNQRGDALPPERNPGRSSLYDRSSTASLTRASSTGDFD